MSRDAATLAAVGSVLLQSRQSPGPLNNVPPAESPRTELPFSGALVAPELLALADPEVGLAVDDYLAAWAVTVGLPDLQMADLLAERLPAWLAAFQTVQGYEAWQHHGPWVSRHWSSLGADVAARFNTASGISRRQAEDARDVLSAARQHIRSVIGNGLLVLPSASSVAPLITEARLGAAPIESVRRTTMQLTCIAGIAGLPAVNVPLAAGDGLPCGVSIIGPANRDADILALAIQLSEKRLTQRKNEHA
jgi:Asp-tRNA(Asn)/Glu-tRNA(Gln) amidotransferase A subunit family amidase